MFNICVLDKDLSELKVLAIKLIQKQRKPLVAVEKRHQSPSFNICSFIFFSESDMNRKILFINQMQPVKLLVMHGVSHGVHHDIVHGVTHSVGQGVYDGVSHSVN